MFRRPAPATVISLVALVFSLSGVAVAAKPYVLDSTSQINPTVLKALKGKKGAKGPKGATGAAGAPGAAGAAGATGATGAPGPFPDALPSGKTVRGVWAVAGDGTAPAAESSISFVWPMALPPNVLLVPLAGPIPTGCSGTVERPAASPGNLCIFEGFSTNATSFGVFNPANGVNNVSGLQGIVVFAHGATAAPFEQVGTWAVTPA